MPGILLNSSLTAQRLTRKGPPAPRGFLSVRCLRFDNGAAAP
jgi:hypothetical protein